jgi:glutamate-5-semialdehyde dehydrogenase
MSSEVRSPIQLILQSTRQAARTLAKARGETRNQALEAIALALENHKAEILAANQVDVNQAESANLAKALIGRLKLDGSKFDGMVAGVRDVRRLADPLGSRQIYRELDRGLVLERLTCPLGVVGIIFEARPDAVSQIVSLAIKSGNGLLLKGGSEAIRSCEAIVQAISEGLTKTEISTDVVQLLTTRAEITEILDMDREIDLIIPRGSNDLVRYIQANTRIPVLGHADGICHLYVERTANLDRAIAITVDAKTQYPSACNAIETLLVDRAIASKFLPLVAKAMPQVELRGCERTLEILQNIKPANNQDWQTEYCDLILAIKVVEDLESAISHINQYGSKHTEAIITEDAIAAQTFMTDVDAAGVFHNCSTRFADGFRYGFGAEVGISTQKMPPRGPVGLEGLVTYKYQLRGEGQIVATYSGKNAQAFTHLDLE